MKLAEALITRAELQKKIGQICRRMEENAKTQEGEEPAEDVDALILLFEAMTEELEAVIKRINRTNALTAFANGTLTDAIARRDCLQSRISAYRGLYAAAVIKQDRYSRSEIKYTRCVNTVKTQSTIDSLSKKFRELDTAMQAANWTTELVD